MRRDGVGSDSIDSDARRANICCDVVVCRNGVRLHFEFIKFNWWHSNVCARGTAECRIFGKSLMAATAMIEMHLDIQIGCDAVHSICWLFGRIAIIIHCVHNGCAPGIEFCHFVVANNSISKGHRIRQCINGICMSIARLHTPHTNCSNSSVCDAYKPILDDHVNILWFESFT